MSLFESSSPHRADNPFAIHKRTPALRISDIYPALATPSVFDRPPPRRAWRPLQSEGVVAMLITFLLLGLFFIPAPLRSQLLSAVSLHSPEEASSSEPRAFSALRHVSLSSPFGRRWGRSHQGVDLAAQTGTSIYAVDAGIVVYSGWQSGYGRTVLIEHRPGFQTRYAHCSRLLVKTGERVRQGRLIARVGSSGHSTGPHLHFEVLINGRPRNPARYYAFDSASHQEREAITPPSS